jgi:hypothetical protein
MPQGTRPVRTGAPFRVRVKRTAQAGNTLRRGTREAESGNQIDLRSQIAGQRAKIELTDLSGQFVRLEAWQDREKIHISRVRPGTDSLAEDPARHHKGT